jgi:S1-C subfamily serine protease
VDIYTRLQYQGAAAAGTGVVLTSDGEILTNNHVINGATTIRVVVVSTGKTYTAKVVGTVPTKDIALLKIENASGLQTANLGNSDSVAVGDQVTGVGNAGGNGGTPSAASGKVTALNKTITASDEDGSGAETLHGVIVTDAPIQAGDSGGPLYNADNKVIGIDTAASTSGQSVGFAIPINNALALVQAIRTGVQTSAVHIGYPGFLGVSVAPSQGGGALIEQVVTGGPAAKAGIEAGDVITRVGSTTITNANQLQKAVSTKDPGDKVSVSYTDQNNTRHTASVTLATGPAD